MFHQADYSALDRQEFLQYIFYPRKDSTTPPPDTTDHLVPVEKGMSISCRFYVHHRDSPSILFFHGNGEVVSDYDDIAPFYNQLGINLFVADYRGYGTSSGVPTFSSMIADAHTIFKDFRKILQQDNYRDSVFVMGRSLGSVSAIELAFHYPQQMKGLIIESGIGTGIKRMMQLGFPTELLDLIRIKFPNLSKMQTITLPTLIIHAELDSLMPLSEARDLFDNAATKEKRLVIIPGTDHNDIMLYGIEPYFKAIQEFVFQVTSS